MQNNLIHCLAAESLGATWGDRLWCYECTYEMGCKSTCVDSGLIVLKTYEGERWHDVLLLPTCAVLAASCHHSIQIRRRLLLLLGGDRLGRAPAAARHLILFASAG